MARAMKIGPRERALLIILGGVVVLAAIYLLFLRPSESPGEPVEGPTPRARPTAIQTLPTTSPTPQTVEVFEGRDPFEPRVRPGGGGTPAPGATGETRSGRRIILLDIFERDGVLFASVSVDGEVHNVKEGDVFEGNFRVVSITRECATFVMGDERFTLCIGQEVFK